MLAHFRQSIRLYVPTLLSVLLFVWLSLALMPCVMASSISDTDTAAMHEKMADCAYCPANSHETMVDFFTLCQNNHQVTDDSVSLAIDKLSAESFILFELPAAPSLSALLRQQKLPAVQDLSYHYELSPLALTGILRI